MPFHPHPDGHPLCLLLQVLFLYTIFRYKIENNLVNVYPSSCIYKAGKYLEELKGVGVEGENDLPTFNFSFKKKKEKKLLCSNYFLEAISLGRLVVPSPKIVINLTMDL